MGSPISGLIAEAVLQRLEAKVFQTFTPKLWKRYVDDTLNNALPGIQFTPDKEKDSNLPFLYILSHRLPTGGLESSVYRKSTHSDVVLNFHSNSPVSHKQSTSSSKQPVQREAQPQPRTNRRTHHPPFGGRCPTYSSSTTEPLQCQDCPQTPLRLEI